MSGNGLNVMPRLRDLSFKGPGMMAIKADTTISTAMSCGDKRVLVVSVSAGSGHVRAADALCAHALHGFSDLSLRHRDMMRFVPSWFKKIYTDFYLKLASGLPEVWGWLYRTTDQQPINRPVDRLRRLIQRLCSQALFAEIGRYAPDAIICTHFLPAELLADALGRGQLNIPVWVVVTDFDVHQMWVHPNVTGYFVANEELSYRLQTAGIPESKIMVTGIPVMPEFTQSLQRDQCRVKWTLDPNRVTLLMMSGGAGMGMSSMLIQSLLNIDASLQLIILTGRNQRLFEELNTLACFCGGRLLPVPFTERVAELMTCADLVITKPGGLSTSECLVMGLPMLLIQPVPGQEERNAALLLQEGVAQRADDKATLLYRLRRLLSDTHLLSTMRSRTQSLAQPHAARLILQHVKQTLTKAAF